MSNTHHKPRQSTLPSLRNSSPLASGVRKIKRVPNQRPSKMVDNDPRFDVILAMQEPYMQQIVSGDKSYEFRKYKLREEVKRVWFYRTAPHSALEYICEIEPARTRGPGQSPLLEPGLGNQEFNTGHEDWQGYDFAYKIVSVYKLKQPLLLRDLQKEHFMKSAPRGWMYTPKTIVDAVPMEEQERIR